MKRIKLVSMLAASACAIGLGAAQAQPQPQGASQPGAAAPQQDMQQQSVPQQSYSQYQGQQGQQTEPQNIPNQMSGAAMQGLPIDQETQVDGVQVMCGGIGSDESDPRFSQYPAKIEVAGGYGQWLGNNDIDISGSGQNISAHCSGPWFAAQLQPGSYSVTVTTRGASPKTVRLNVSGEGQRKVVVRFPELQQGKDTGQGAYTGTTL